MTTPLHFRFLIDHVESSARCTPAVLFSESVNFWDDLLVACERRGEKPNYWIFCTRWVREALLEVMQGGSARALDGILRVLKPGATVLEPESEAGKRRTIAHLLPLLLAETLLRIEQSAVGRSGDPFEDAPRSYHQEDY